MALADLPADLPDGEDLLDPRCRRGQEVEGLRHGADPSDDRDAQVQLEVLAQRRLGVHGHEREAVGHPLWHELRRRHLECRREVALGVDLAAEDRAALVGQHLGQARGDGGLADAALAGDEDQVPLDERRGAHRRAPDQGAPNPTRRSAVGAPTSR